jgi:hypothetical protein
MPFFFHVPKMILHEVVAPIKSAPVLPVMETVIFLTYASWPLFIWMAVTPSYCSLVQNDDSDSEHAAKFVSCPNFVDSGYTTVLCRDLALAYI